MAAQNRIRVWKQISPSHHSEYSVFSFAVMSYIQVTATYGKGLMYLCIGMLYFLRSHRVPEGPALQKGAGLPYSLYHVLVLAALWSSQQFSCLLNLTSWLRALSVLWGHPSDLSVFTESDQCTADGNTDTSPPPCYLPTLLENAVSHKQMSKTCARTLKGNIQFESFSSSFSG